MLIVETASLPSFSISTDDGAFSDGYYVRRYRNLNLSDFYEVNLSTVYDRVKTQYIINGFRWSHFLFFFVFAKTRRVIREIDVVYT